MSLTYPIDPSLPSNPSPFFSDTSAARGDHLRGNNAEIWGNFASLQLSKVEGPASSVLNNLLLFGDTSGKVAKDGGIGIGINFTSKVDTLLATVKGTSDYIDALFPVGIILPYAGITIPNTFWSACNGNSLLRASYPTAWANLSATVGTCTISQATPAVVHKVGHGLSSGACIAFTSTGSPPSPLGVETNYYITVVDGDNFKVSTTFANYLAGTFVSTTNAGSGIHTLRFNPWGIADSTRFNIPDVQGLSIEGAGQQSYAAWASVNYVGGLGQYRQDRMQGHYHRWGSTTDRFWADVNNGVGGEDAQTTMTKFNDYHVLQPISDGTNGTPRTGITTYGPHVGMNYMIRVL